MRPFAQGAVIATHALIFLGSATSLLATSLLFLTRFSRESFFFITALVLTYAYVNQRPMRLARFWRRRVAYIGLPYLTWTVIYYVFVHATPENSFPFYGVPWRFLVSGAGLHDFATLLVTGYYQLYFIVVLFQFYVVFPLVLFALRRWRRWHLPVIVVAFLWQIAYDVMIRRHLFPFAMTGKLESRLIISYPIYLLGGVVIALNLRAAHEWLLRHTVGVIVGTLATAALALALDHVQGSSFVAQFVAPRLDVAAPLAVLYNVGAICCLYRAGVYLSSRRRRALTRDVVSSTARASFGIYLSQMIWIPLLVRVTAKLHLHAHLPWLAIVVMAVAIVFLVGYALTLVAERTPLALALVGRARVPWRRSKSSMASL